MSMEFFDFIYTWEILPILIKAFWVTIKATLVGFILAAVAGLLFAVLRRSPARWIRWPVTGFLEFIRSTPLLVQLFFLYYVLPQYGIKFEAFTIGVLALGFHYSSYTAEVYRSGIESIPKEQWEAAIALNYRRPQIWTKIIIPQAIPPVVPVLGNYLITMFKDAPLLAAITVVNAMHMVQKLGARTYQYLEPMTLLGALMLVVSLISAFLVQRLDKYLKSRRGV